MLFQTNYRTSKIHFNLPIPNVQYILPKHKRKDLYGGKITLELY